MRSWQHGAAVLFLGSLIASAPAQAFSDTNMQHFRESRYKSCPKCDLSGVELSGADLSGANLQEANLSQANLQKANLFAANLQKANLFAANLQKANLIHANLQEANLLEANLQEADLSFANLQEAILFAANLQEAILFAANLQEANLRQAMVGKAQLSYAQFAKAIYAPASLPPDAYLAGIEGLDLVVIPSFGDAIGLVQLRKLLQENGLPEERQATYAIEHNKTGNLLFGDGHYDSTDAPRLRWDKPFSTVEGAFRWLAFELPVGYGLYPGRALLVLIGAIGVFALVYAVALATEVGNIYRVWPAGRLDPLDGAALASSAKAEPLLLWRSWAALGRGLQFSLLSAFNIGFRELNVGNWLARLQTREYELRAVGWVRAVAGVQSLLSVYLVAMWALTYFGRPFG